MGMFAQTIDAVTQAINQNTDPVAAIDAAVGHHNLRRVRPGGAGIADTAQVDPLILAGDRYATLRKFAPDLIEALALRGGKGSARSCVISTAPASVTCRLIRRFRSARRGASSSSATTASRTGASGRSGSWPICAPS